MRIPRPRKCRLCGEELVSKGVKLFGRVVHIECKQKFDERQAAKSDQVQAEESPAVSPAQPKKRESLEARIKAFDHFYYFQREMILKAVEAWLVENDVEELKDQVRTFVPNKFIPILNAGAIPVKHTFGEDGSEFWEGRSSDERVDFHIREEDGVFMLDLYRSGVENADEAHIDTFECDSLEEAVASGATWILE